MVDGLIPSDELSAGDDSATAYWYDPRQYPIWPAIVAGMVAVPISFAFQITVLVGGYFVANGFQPITSVADVQQWVREFAQQPGGILWMVLPGQLAFLGLAFGVARLGREPVGQWLGLSDGVRPRWQWIVFAMSTPVVAVTWAIVLTYAMSALDIDKSRQAESLEAIFRAHRGWQLPALLVAVCLVPAVCEELLFRGLIQNRLLKRLSPPVAIMIAACLFSMAHVDVAHALGVLPLGIWLGILAWRCQSIWPAIMGHMINNAFMILTIQVEPHQDDPRAAASMSVLLLFTLAAFVVSMPLLFLPLRSKAFAVEPEHKTTDDREI